MIGVKPMLAQLAKKPFDGGSEWGFEVKWDGERAICEIERSSYILYSRNNKDLKYKYPELGEIAKLVKAHTVTFDGEICVVNEDGISSFEMLQNRMGLTNRLAIAEAMQKYPVHYFVFDILEIDGRKLFDKTLVQRQKILKETLTEGEFIHLTEMIVGNGKKIFNAAKKMGLEGILAKKLNSKYLMDERSGDWLKIKARANQEFAILGWTKGQGAREGLFGSLVMGVYSESGWVYAGHVGTGFSVEMSKDFIKHLKVLTTNKCPFEKVPEIAQTDHWLVPKLVAQVEFTEWTKNGTLRQPSFIGLREDKKPKECIKE